MVDVFEEVYEFNAAIETFTLAELEFKLVIETPCESFVDLAADAELIKEPVMVDNAELNDEKFVVLYTSI